MRILSVIFTIAFLAISAMPGRAATHLVLMNNFSFVPRDITVDVGDTIIWTNTVITGHDTVSAGVWESPLLGRRQTFSFTFNVAPRRYDYVCRPHVPFGMVGSVTVRAPVNNPPTSLITSPANGQPFRVGDPVTVNVDATDTGPGGVSKVDLFVDGALAQTDSTSPYQFTLPNLAPGQHTLLARATDAGGLTADSSILINVQFANPAPTVVITSPTNNASFNEPATIVIQAEATGNLERVEFLTNGVVIATNATSPYLITNIFARGTYILTARAISTDTQVTLSAPVQIEVGEPLPIAPIVNIVSPTTSQEIIIGSLLLAAEASDLDGAIAQVRFFTPSGALGSATAPAISNRFELAPSLLEGLHTVFAVATDDTGLSATSAPVTFRMVLLPERTYMTNVPPNILRLGYFGSSGVPYVFEQSTDMTNWIPFLTNQFYRRIFFFDVEKETNGPMRIVRPRPY